MEVLELWRREHGDDFYIPRLVLNALAECGFKDESWRNDACPVFRRYKRELQYVYEVWVNHLNREDRDVPELPRFVITMAEIDAECCMVNCSHILYGTESAEMIIVILQTLRPLFEYGVDREGADSMRVFGSGEGGISQTRS